MPTIDDELSQIEKDIRRLKIEYEQFFGGGRGASACGHAVAARIFDPAL